jgi:hypothetical protein
VRGSGSSSAILVAFLTFATLVGLTGYQVTHETSSVRLLGRLGAALIELDRWLPAHRDDIELAARDRPNQPLVLDGLPIDVAIPASAVLEAPEPVLRATIVEAMGRRLYEDGYSAIADEEGESHLGLTEPLRWAVDALNSSAHSFWRIVMITAGLTLAAVCVGHVWMRQSPLAGIAAGSAVAAIGALVVWLLVSALGSSVSGAIDEEIARVARDGIWLGLRNSLAALAIGVGGLYAVNTLFGRRGDEGWEDWEEYGFEPHDPESREAPPY